MKLAGALSFYFLNLVTLLLDKTFFLKNGGKVEILRRFGASLGQLTEAMS